jgi:hypothetical protein
VKLEMLSFQAGKGKVKKYAFLGSSDNEKSKTKTPNNKQNWQSYIGENVEAHKRDPD